MTNFKRLNFIIWWRKSPYKIAKTKVFGDNFNKTRQRLSDVILVDVSQLADGPKEHPLQSNFVSFPDLLAKAYLAKPLASFGKTFVRRSGTRFGFLLVPRGVFRPIYTYFKPNCLNFYSSLSYS